MACITSTLTPSPSFPLSLSLLLEMALLEMLVILTSIIDQPLLITKILTVLHPQSLLLTVLGQGIAVWDITACTFMITDTFSKLCPCALLFSDGHTYHIARIDKGMGMIYPNMLGAPPSCQFQLQLHTMLLRCIAIDVPTALPHCSLP
jgi:hypothetical protein